MTNTPWLRRALRLSALALSAVVIVALVLAMRQNGPAALEAWRTTNIQWTWVVLATACGFSGHAIYLVGWLRLLRDCGVQVSFWRAAQFFLVSNVGRYLPGGKAWQMGIIGVMAAENELPATLVAATSLLQGVLGVAVGAILLLATGGATLGVAPVWFALPVVGVAGLLAAPVLLKALPRLRAVIVQRLPSIDSVNTATMWALVWTATASWIMWGVALDTLARAVLPTPGASVIAYIAAWIGSFSAGLIAIMTPAGLGVRDGVMQVMLARAGVIASSALVFALVARVWVTIMDVVPAVIVLALRQRSRRRIEGPPSEPGTDTAPAR